VLVPQERLLNRMRPRHGQGIVLKDRTGKSKRRGKAVNGLKTSYFYGRTENSKNNSEIHLQMPDHWQSSSKIYSKQLDGVWYIRCEITFRRGALIKRFPELSKGMEYNQSNYVDLIFDRLDTFEFYDFWQLLKVDCEGFRDRAKKIARRKIAQQKYPRLLSLYLAHLNYCFDGRADKRLIHQITLMRAIARRLKSTVLENAIIKEYTSELTLEEVLNRPLSSETDTTSQRFI
jgi:hypothetical protein